MTRKDMSLRPVSAPATWHEELTPGKPSGDPPLFYLERHSDGQGVTHALNAFMGGPVLTVQDLADVYRESLLSNLQEEIQATSAAEFDREYGEFFSADEREQYLSENRNSRQLAEVLQAKLGAIDAMSDFSDPFKVVFQGSLTEWGVAALNGKREALGVPEARYRSFRGSQEEERQVLDFVRERQAQTDRFVLVAGVRHLALRQAASGQWYELDGSSGQREIASPLALMEKRLRLERDEPAKRGDYRGVSRFEFVAFSGSVEPQLNSPLPHNVSLV